MIPAQLQGFMEKLLTWTENGKLRWQEGAAQGSYLCRHKDYAVHISYWFDPDAERGIYTTRITRDARDAQFYVTDTESDAYIMRNLLAAVTVNAANFDGIADDFFAD